MNDRFCSRPSGKCDFRLRDNVKDAYPCTLNGYCTFQLPKVRYEDYNPDDDLFDNVHMS